MKAFIHIGMVKTGSTTIQGWQRLNHAALAEEGIFCLNRPNGSHSEWPLLHAGAHTALEQLGTSEESLVRRFTREGIARFPSTTSELSSALENIAGKDGVYFGSCELMFESDPNVIRGIDHYLSGFFDQREYIVYLRNATDAHVSMYSQALRSGTDLTFADHVTRFPHENYKFRRYAKLKDWSENTESTLNVRLLEPNWLVGGDLLQDIASVLGGSVHKIPTRLNEAIALEFLEYARTLNVALKDEKRHSLEDLSRRQIMRILTEMSCDKAKAKISDQHASLIEATTSAESEQIRHEFFPELSALFSQPDRGAGAYPEALTEQRLSELDAIVGAKLIQNLRRRAA